MAKLNNRAFIVDDDAIHNDMLKQVLVEKFGLDVMAFTNGDDALRNLQWNPTYVFCDYHLDRMNSGLTAGSDVMRQVRQALPDAYFVVMSSQDKMDITADAMKHGAYDHVVKNTTGFLRIENSTAHALQHARLRGSLKTYQTAAVMLGTLFVAAVVVIYFLLQRSGAATTVEATY